MLPVCCMCLQRNSITKTIMFSPLFKKDFIYLFLERGEGKGKERERNINMWLPPAHPQLGTWPTTQACALTRNQTSDPLVLRPELNPLNHTSQGCFLLFMVRILTLFFCITCSDICEHLLF